MLSHIEHILSWYAQKPVEVRHKKERRVPSRAAEYLREKEAKEQVSRALNRYAYQSER